MGTVAHTSLDGRGRLVIPVGTRERQGWRQGTRLLLIEIEHGVMLATRGQAKQLTREQLASHDPVASLIAERRATAVVEDLE